ncbi:AI-2E family transporter [candidate division KSB1 bacterium]|nr:AI-2E family transporter [candidate division KSB1 bacterium]
MEKGIAEKYQTVIVICGILLIGVLLYLVRSILSPLLLLLVIFIFLLPFRQLRITRSMLVLAALVFFVWFIREAAQLLIPFFLSFVVAYLFDPLVDRFERWKIPRWISVLSIELFVLALFVLLVIVLLPQIINEFRDLITVSVDYSNRFAVWLQNDALIILQRLHVDISKIQEVAFQDLSGKVQTIIETTLKSAINITSTLSTALGQLINLILVPFLLFYFLKDFDKIKKWVIGLFPVETGTIFENYLRRIDNILSGFFRGQLIVGLIVGTLTGGGLLLLGVKYSLILGVMAGLSTIVPYVGLLITLGFGIVVGIFSPFPLITCIKIVGVIEAVQIMEGSFLAPRIVGDRVGLHPVWVIFSILVFSHFGGFLGLVVAVPTAATLKIFIQTGLDHYRNKFIKSA